MKTKPTKGQKLYRFWGDEIEQGFFIEESIADGTSVPTWVVRYYPTGLRAKRCRCSVGSWFLSEAEATRHALDGAKASVGLAKASVVSARQWLAYERVRVKQLRARLKEL